MLDRIVAKLLAEIDGALSFFEAIRNESPLVYETSGMNVADGAISQLRIIRSLFPECNVPEEVNLEHAFSAAWSLWCAFDALSDDTDDRVLKCVASALYGIAENCSTLVSPHIFQAVKSHLEDTGETLEGKPNLQAFMNYWQSRINKAEEDKQ